MRYATARARLARARRTSSLTDRRPDPSIYVASRPRRPRQVPAPVRRTLRVLTVAVLWTALVALGSAVLGVLEALLS